MRSIGLALAILLCCASGVSAQVVNAPTVGGTGGGPFDDACKPGDVMTGYNAISGKAMDTFAAVCQAQVNGGIVGKDYGLRTWGKHTYNGGDFNAWDTPRCPAGTAISSLHVLVNKFNELDSVSATCIPMRPITAVTASALPTTNSVGQASRSGDSACPAGMLAVGVTGRSGALMDAVGLKCSSFPWHQGVGALAPGRPPPRRFVTVIRAVDVYDRPSPPRGDSPKGSLAAGTANVTLSQRGPVGWYQLNWPGAPAGNDWVYSASDYQSLDPATLGP